MKKPSLIKRGGRKSKQKGARFEREICNKLSLWLSYGKSKHLLWRSSMSGGRATIARRKQENLSIQAGDLAAIDPAAQRFVANFFVECKHYASLHLGSLHYPIKGVLIPMWKKLQLQAYQHKKIPLMIVRENGRPTLLLTSGYPPCIYSLLVAHYRVLGIHVYLLDSVLKMDPELFIKEGEYENSRHGGLTPNRSSKRRLSLVLPEVVVGSRLSESGNSRRPNRRERLS